MSYYDSSDNKIRRKKLVLVIQIKFINKKI